MRIKKNIVIFSIVVATMISFSKKEVKSMDNFKYSNEKVVINNNNYINVKDLGASGDGEADDLGPIQEAINIANENPNRNIVYLPKGVYKVKSFIVLRSNVVIKMDKEAVILNGLNSPNHPSIPIMTGMFVNGGNKVVWGGVSNVTIEGGIIDMNGALGEDGKKPKNLPDINSTGGMAIGYSKNIVIRNVTFKNAFNGHALQLADSHNVLVENCKFLGQSIPVNAKDSSVITKELVQIEPGTRKGFPYSARESKEGASDIIIRNSYFGKSDECPEPVTFIGTHYQNYDVEKCQNIKIYKNVFDNPYYSAIRFCGYDNIEIFDNKFYSKSKKDSLHKRDGGTSLINSFTYNDSKKEKVNPSKNVKIEDNEMFVSDENCIPVRIVREASSKATSRQFSVLNNKIYSTFNNSSYGIYASRVQDILIEKNEIKGFYKGILLDRTSGDMIIKDNKISDTGFSNIVFENVGNLSGDKGDINISTEGNGNIDVEIKDKKVNLFAIPYKGSEFVSWSDGNKNSKIYINSDKLNLKALFK